LGKYDDISSIHAKTMTAFKASNQRLKSLRERVYSLKELEARVGEIYWDILESQKSLQALSREAEEAMKLHQ